MAQLLHGGSAVGPWTARVARPQRCCCVPLPAQVKDYVARFAKAEDVEALEAEERHKGPHHEGEAMSEDDEEGALPGNVWGTTPPHPPCPACLPVPAGPARKRHAWLRRRGTL